VTRSESNGAVTIDVDGATGERYDVAVDLAGPSDAQPAVSVSSVGVTPAGDFEAFETTIGRPAAEPDDRNPVPHGVALGYIEFGSSLGATETSAATLQMTVDEGAIPRGLDQEDVAVMRYVDGEWTTANVTHEVAGATHTATLPHATPVAVVALEPGRVDVVAGTVPVDRVRAGYGTTLRATVANPGDRRATRNLTVTMDGETLAQRQVSLAPGENTTVEITFEPRESGSVSLEGEEVGSVELFADTGGPATSTGTDGSVPGFGALLAVLALLVTALAWGRRS
jgi:PGF-CTERM protein